MCIRDRLLPSQAAACLAFLLEVTGGMGAAAQLGVGPLFYAFGLAFGGLCVHMQDVYKRQG